MVDGIAMKGKLVIIIHLLLQKQILQQLHSNHMGIEVMRLLVCKTIYWVNTNTDIENTVKQCATCKEYQQTQSHEHTIPYEMSCKPWVVTSANAFSIKNSMLLCIVHYYSKFHVGKKTDHLSVDNLIREATIVFTKFGLPKKTVSDTVMNFISDKFTQFCRQLNIEQAVMSSCHHQSNGQEEACIKFMKCTTKIP